MVASEEVRCRHLSCVAGHTGDFLLCRQPASGGCRQQLHGAFVPRAPCHHGNPEAFQAGTVHMPASTPSGVGTCHHGNSSPALNKGLSNRPGTGVEGLGAGLTLARLAVKSTHSKSCPILWRNSSTCGRFSTYTCNGTRQQAGQVQQLPGVAIGPDASVGGFSEMVPAPSPWGLCTERFLPGTLLRLGSRPEWGADAPPRGGRKADHGPEGPGDFQDQ